MLPYIKSLILFIVTFIVISIFQLWDSHSCFYFYFCFNFIWTLCTFFSNCYFSLVIALPIILMILSPILLVKFCEKWRLGCIPQIFFKLSNIVSKRSKKYEFIRVLIYQNRDMNSEFFLVQACMTILRLFKPLYYFVCQ